VHDAKRDTLRNKRHNENDREHAEGSPLLTLPLARGAVKNGAKSNLMENQRNVSRISVVSRMATASMG